MKERTLVSRQISLGPRLRAWREHVGLSQAEVERRAGLAHNALSRIETEAVCPRLETIERIASVLGLSIEQVQFRLPPQEKCLDGNTEQDANTKKLLKLIESLTGDRRVRVIRTLIALLEEVRG